MKTEFISHAKFIFCFLPTKELVEMALTAPTHIFHFIIEELNRRMSIDEFVLFLESLTL